MINLGDATVPILGALSAALSGGIFAEWMRGRLKLKEAAQIDSTTTIRKEQSELIKELQEQVRAIRKEADEWQDKYYKEAQEHTRQITALEAKYVILQANFDRLNASSGIK